MEEIVRVASAASGDVCTGQTLLGVNLCNFKLGVLTNNTLGGVLGTIMGVVFLILGITAFGYLLYGGAKFITSGGDADKVSEARNTILYAIIGILVIGISYAVLTWAAGLVKPAA